MQPIVFVKNVLKVISFPATYLNLNCITMYFYIPDKKSFTIFPTMFILIIYLFVVFSIF